MNVRLSAEGLRFRVNEEELGTLAGGTPLEQGMALADGQELTLRIEPDAAVDGLRLRCEPGRWVLHVALPALRHLAAHFPDEQRLSSRWEVRPGRWLQCLFEVDLHRKWGQS